MFTDPQNHPSKQNKNERKREERGTGKEWNREGEEQGSVGPAKGQKDGAHSCNNTDYTLQLPPLT